MDIHVKQGSWLTDENYLVFLPCTNQQSSRLWRNNTSGRNNRKDRG